MLRIVSNYTERELPSSLLAMARGDVDPDGTLSQAEAKILTQQQMAKNCANDVQTLLVLQDAIQRAAAFKELRARGNLVAPEMTSDVAPECCVL